MASSMLYPNFAAYPLGSALNFAYSAGLFNAAFRPSWSDLGVFRSILAPSASMWMLLALNCGMYVLPSCVMVPSWLDEIYLGEFSLSRPELIVSMVPTFCDRR